MSISELFSIGCAVEECGPFRVKVEPSDSGLSGVASLLAESTVELSEGIVEMKLVKCERWVQRDSVLSLFHSRGLVRPSTAHVPAFWRILRELPDHIRCCAFFHKPVYHEGVMKVLCIERNGIERKPFLWPFDEEWDDRWWFPAVVASGRAIPPRHIMQ